MLLGRAEPAAAAEVALGAAAEAERAGLRLEELEARLLSGRALLAGGDREPALEQLQRVAATAGAAGARALQAPRRASCAAPGPRSRPAPVEPGV